MNGDMTDAASKLLENKRVADRIVQMQSKEIATLRREVRELRARLKEADLDIEITKGRRFTLK